MAENSAIEWTTHTFNPWIGCTRVSPGCQHCYAETLMADRYGRVVWGPKGERSRTSDANWKKPLAWNRAAEKAETVARVFCASLADVFDEHASILPEWRAELFALIDATPWLDWQLLTKRPENVMGMLPDAWHEWGIPRNVWIGTSVEDQRRAGERIPALLKIPARVRFLSCEPLLAPVDLRTVYRDAMDEAHDVNCLNGGIGWVIVGGESGKGARPMNLEWARDIVRDCRNADVPVFVKQLGAVPVEERVLYGITEFGPVKDGIAEDVVHLRSKKGGDMNEWPEDLRVREMPNG